MSILFKLSHIYLMNLYYTREFCTKPTYQYENGKSPYLAHRQIDSYMHKWSETRLQNLIIHLHVLAEAQGRPFFFIYDQHER